MGAVPGGQERQRFDFTAEFPPMEVHCQAPADPRYAASLGYAVANRQQQPFKSGLRPEVR